MAVSAPADRRFKRARVGPRSPRGWQGRARLFMRLGVLVVAFGAAGVATFTGLARNSALAVNDIRVSGLHRLTPPDIVALIPEVRRASIFTVRLDDVRARLLESPWIEDASVRRVLPQTIELIVVERHPIGVARFPSGLFLIDGSGAIVDRFGPRYADLNVPIVDGFEVMPRAGIRVEPARAHLATKLLRALGEHPDLLRRLSHVDVSDDRNAVITLEGDPALLHLGHERFVERLQAYLDMAPALRERVQAIDYIDLRFEQRVYLRPVLAKANPAIGTKKDTAAPAAESETESGPDPGLADEVAPPREPAQ